MRQFNPQHVSVTVVVQEASVGVVACYAFRGCRPRHRKFIGQRIYTPPQIYYKVDDSCGPPGGGGGGGGSPPTRVCSPVAIPIQLQQRGDPPAEQVAQSGAPSTPPWDDASKAEGAGNPGPHQERSRDAGESVVYEPNNQDLIGPNVTF